MRFIKLGLRSLYSKDMRISRMNWPPCEKSLTKKVPPGRITSTRWNLILYSEINLYK